MDINETPELLLDRARFMRVEAARAREIAETETQQDVRDGLVTLAACWLARAQALERRALRIAPSQTVVGAEIGIGHPRRAPWALLRVRLEP